MDILQLLDRPVAFQRSFVRLGAGVTGALLLSQLVYWANRTSDEDGWVYKTQEDWESETGLTRYEQEGARKKLRSLGLLIEQKKGLPAQLFYKVDVGKLNQLLASACKDAELPQTSKRKSSKPAAVKPANIHTENTTENTTPPNPQGDDADAPVEPPKIKYQDVADAYNEILGERLPKVQELNDKRKRQIKRLLGELHEPTLEVVRAYFETFRDSAGPFYFGDNNRTWRAGFDYLLRSDVLTKTREGAL
ncbi:replication protein [Serratia rubidaea]|uniref:replication protein n=1 Tax=Serratia rubidaea TaxID=61652 RepID=UPI001780E6BF|nr:replication protein [Serratia rubidaea]MBD8451849.1 replication protein [Serratia rubidaea]